MFSVEKILERCEEKNAILCLATKTQTPQRIAEKLISEKMVIAENRLQEALEKKIFFENIPNEKHFIGELQKNKVRKAVLFFDVIQSVHSFEILHTIDRIAREEGKKQRIFLNLNISKDEHKSGFLEEEFLEGVDKKIFLSCQNVAIEGLFCILKNGLSLQEKAKYYAKMKKIFDDILPKMDGQFRHLSMGMSDDFEMALQNGATMVRVGSAIFGERHISF